MKEMKERNEGGAEGWDTRRAPEEGLTEGKKTAACSDEGRKKM